MRYRTFVTFNVIGGVGWATLMLTAGWALGKAFPAIGSSLDYVLLVIIAVSLIPVGIEYLRHRRHPERETTPLVETIEAVGHPTRRADLTRGPRSIDGGASRFWHSGAMDSQDRARWAADAFDRLADFVAVIDPAGDVVYANPFAERMLELEPGEGVGRSMGEFLHPEDLVRAVRVMTMMVDRAMDVPVTPAVYRVGRADDRVASRRDQRVGDPRRGGRWRSAR